MIRSRDMPDRATEGQVTSVPLALFAAVIGLSSFLLFLVQPIIAKQLLPWFGGSSAVWITCLVFFQIALLAGYAYAHAIARYLGQRRQGTLHIALLAVSLLFLPIIPGEFLKPVGAGDPGPQVVMALLATVGMPYFLLATTGPLLQRWVAPRFAEGTVYRLFALSNLASLAGLIAFPFLIEPYVDSIAQSRIWSLAYLLFVACAMLIAWHARKSTVTSTPQLPNLTFTPHICAEFAKWVCLSAMGSIVLLGTTAHITQNIASVPFLWVLPLAIYLLSFVIVFDGRRGKGWYERRWGVPAMQVTVVLMAVALTASQGTLHILLAVPLYCAGLFAACVFCHGELALRKPSHAFLTHYYLAIAIGGALGGVTVAVIAPHVYDAYFELPVILFMLALAGVAVTRTQTTRRGIALIAALATCYFGITYATFIKADSIWMERNFYGVMRVQHVEQLGIKRFVHGVIAHGEQSLDSSAAQVPRTYFSKSSGGGRAIGAAQKRGPITAGVIGLGVGTLAAYSRPGDRFRFYELDADVLRVAREQFTYVGHAAGTIEHVIGDARLSIEEERKEGKLATYDVFVVDAFSSDSIPVHLLTQEAFELYDAVLREDGVLALHVSNKFLDLPLVIRALAKKAHWQAKLVEDRPPVSSGGSPSQWVLMKKAGTTWNAELVDLPNLDGTRIVNAWTDQYSSLFGIVRGVSGGELQALVR